MLKTMRENFSLAMVLLLCSCTIIAITPFALWRVLTADWLMAAVDLSVIIATASVLVYAWRTQKINIISLLLAIFYTAAAVLVSYLHSHTMAYWLFPAITANFFVLRLRFALVLNTLALLAAVPLITQFAQTLEFFELLVTLILVNAFSGIFAWKTQDQHRQLRSLANIDPLTGVGNRRKLYQQLEQHPHESNSASIGAIILLDIDHFKKINDSQGHAAGDAMLQKITTLITQRLRTHNDELYRYGGEEFLLLLNKATLANACKVSESLRQQFIRELGSPNGATTASFGCAEHRPGETWEHWIKRADDALYEAKNNGRNCVRPRPLQQ